MLGLDKHILGIGDLNNPANMISCPECNGENTPEVLECHHCGHMLKSDQEVSMILENEKAMKRYEDEQKAKDIRDLWVEYRKTIDKAWKMWESERNKLLRKGDKDNPRIVNGYEEYERKSSEAWADYIAGLRKIRDKVK
jgi:hypothetical protein